MQTLLRQRRLGIYTFQLLFLISLLIGLLVISLAIGAVSISPAEIFQIFAYKIGWSNYVDETQQIVLLSIRLPRLLLTVLVGAALGLSGAVLQGLFRNPLVEPGIIGVSSGSAVGAVLVILFLPPFFDESIRPWLLPLFSFLGGLVATFLTLNLSRYEGRTQITYLILAGVAISSLAGALIGLSIFYADDTQLRTYTFWVLGDLSVASWDNLQILFPLICLSLVGLMSLSRPLNALALGEAEAFHSGVSVEKVKLIAVLLSALAVGTSVAFTGIIGFVGLVIPHIVRIGFTSDHDFVLPASAIGGSCMLLAADIVARTVVEPAELPIGVVTALVGAPFFMYLLISSKKKKLI